MHVVKVDTEYDVLYFVAEHITKYRYDKVDNKTYIEDINGVTNIEGDITKDLTKALTCEGKLHMI